MYSDVPKHKKNGSQTTFYSLNLHIYNNIRVLQPHVRLLHVKEVNQRLLGQPGVDNNHTMTQ